MKFYSHKFSYISRDSNRWKPPFGAPTKPAKKKMSAKNCTFCNTPLTKNDFTCPTCGRGFCKIHVGTNEKFTCSKCKTSHNRDIAYKFGEQCPCIPNSRCPKCGAQLRLDKFPAGQHYISCDKCGWNSFEAQPIIVYQSDSITLREAVSKGFATSAKVCGGTLKKSQGTEFCPHCLLEHVKHAGTVSFSTLAQRTGLAVEDIPSLLHQYSTDYNLTGIIDEPNQLYTYIDPQFRYRVTEQVKQEGVVSLDAIAKSLKIDLSQALNLMYEVIRGERIRGTFSKNKKFYFAANFLQEELKKEIRDKGEIVVDAFAAKNDVHPDIIKDYVVTLLKTKEIDGYLGEKGTKIFSRSRLQDILFNIAEQRKKFKLEDVSGELNVTLELIRITLHDLVKSGRLRGVFTQKREYMTDQALKAEIVQIVTAYRTISLAELARRLAITEKTVEESLASLIARGDIGGYIDLRTREFKHDPNMVPAASFNKPAPVNVGPGPNISPVTISPVGIPAGPATGQVQPADTSRSPAGFMMHEERYIEVVREYDFVGGQVHFKVAIRNNSKAAIFDIKVVLDFPDAFHIEDQMISIPVIEPDSSRGVDFYLEPTNCGKSNVGATVIYKDFTSKVHTVHVEKKEIHVKCPLVVSSMDNINDVNVVTQSLPSDARSFLISDLDARLAYHAGFRAISHFDARCVAAPEKMDGDLFEADAYFATRAKVTGGRIVIKLSVSEKAQVMEIRVWCAEPGQLTGLLAKIIEYLFQEINIIRKIKSEARERTIDLMAVAQTITVLSDYVMLKWKAGDISNKLEDMFARLMKFLKSDEILDEMKSWLDKLRALDEDAPIPEAMAGTLSQAIERWNDAIKRKISPE